MKELKTTKQHNQSSEKVLLIIEIMAKNGSPMRLMDIAEELHSNSSTVLRYLLALRQAGYVEQDIFTQQYYLTFKICRIASWVTGSLDFRNVVKPYMNELASIFHESICLAVKEQDQVVYIEVVDGPDHTLCTMQRIGHIAPMYCTGIGKLFLSEYTEKELSIYLKSHMLQTYTKNTLDTPEKLFRELDNIRARQLAYDNEECEMGACCIAYPLRNYSGKIIAGLSVTGPTLRIFAENVQNCLTELEAASIKISIQMGYDPSCYSNSIQAK